MVPGAALGALAGALAGIALGWCIASETLRVPALSVLVTAGTLVAALAGAGAGGVLGWIVGAIAGLFHTDYIAKRYAGRIRRGGILLSVHCDSPEWSGRAIKTLKDTGARNISSAPESAADFGTTDRPTERAPLAVMERVAPLPATVPVAVPVAVPVVEYVAPEIGK